VSAVQTDVKRTVACSTSMHVAIISSLQHAVSTSASALHTVIHSWFKSSFFSTLGFSLHSSGNNDGRSSTRSGSNTSLLILMSLLTFIALAWFFAPSLLTKKALIDVCQAA
jgi:NADH:ubiquinone oxidoreductase subunit 5 (subunit L)/multisubunit Na+/H+ antiporter MnhA subunit